MNKFRKTTLSLLVFFILIGSLYSCSNDEKNDEYTQYSNDTSVKSRQKYPIVEDEIDQIFYEYVSSNEFYQMNLMQSSLI